MLIKTPVPLQKAIVFEFYKHRFTLKECRAALPKNSVSVTVIQQAYFEARHTGMKRYQVKDYPNLQMSLNKFVEELRQTIDNSLYRRS